jgi:hypothetical protein
MGCNAGVTAAETRERFLSAAAGIFAERGYDGIRVTPDLHPVGGQEWAAQLAGSSPASPGLAHKTGVVP